MHRFIYRVCLGHVSDPQSIDNMPPQCHDNDSTKAMLVQRTPAQHFRRDIRLDESGGCNKVYAEMHWFWLCGVSNSGVGI